MIAPLTPSPVATDLDPRSRPDPGSPYLDPVARIDTLLAEIAAALNAPERASPLRIHGVRKRLKELRALSRLFGPPGGAVRTAAAELADALATARDATAALDALALLTDLPHRTHTALREALTESRHQQESATATADTAVLLRNIDAAWRLHRPAPPDAADLRRHLVKSYRRIRRDAPDARPDSGKPRQAWQASPPLVLHDLRKRVIILRYQLELARPLAPRRIARMIDALQRLRDRLGDVQDLEVLAETPAWAALPPPVAGTALERARHAAIARAHRTFRRLFKARPRAFDQRLARAEGTASIVSSDPVGDRLHA